MPRLDATTKKDVVWLFFDANGRLIEYAEFIYDC